MKTELIEGDVRWPTGMSIGLVTSRFNAQVTERLEAGALERLEQLGAPAESIIRVRVPGAFEIPLAAKALLDRGCDAVVALGAVIRGETTHYDYVCAAVERGCTELQIRYGRPVAFGVLTTETSEQALNRAGGSKGHKGKEAVDVALELFDCLKKLKPNQKEI